MIGPDPRPAGSPHRGGPGPRRTGPTRILTAADVHVRVERETLRRVSRTRAVLFTIRTHTAPLTSVLAHPEVAAELLDVVRSLPADVAAYK